VKFYEYVECMKDTPYTEDVEYSMMWGALLSRVNEWPMNVKGMKNGTTDRKRKFAIIVTSICTFLFLGNSVCLARWGILLPVVTDLKQAVLTREWIICLMVEAKQGIGKNCMKKAWWDRRTGRNRDGF